MEKLKFLLALIISIFVLNTNVFAASGNLSVSSERVYIGDSFTVTTNISSAAAWNVHVSASGPVSGCSINQADATADAMDTNKSFTATCTATGEGVITITLSGDVTSATDGNAVNISGSRSVTVSPRPAPPTENNNNNSNNDTNNTNNNNNPNINNNQATDNRSKNNNIKEVSIEGYNLTKVDNNNYTLSVPNDVTSINIKATAEDSKSKVTGIGNHNINIGENNIEVIVTAENGLQNKINIKVTRKDGYYLEDLDSVLKNNKLTDINITVKSDTKITAQDLEKIRNSKKTVKFNYYNDNKNLVYAWIIDGSKLKNTNDLITTIEKDTENKKDILRLSNYADGLFYRLKQINSLPTGSKIKLFIGDKYKDNDLVNVYAYIKDSDKLNLLENKIKVENGYVELNVTNASDYFITMSTIPNNDKIITTTGKSSSSTLLIIGILSLLVIGLLIAFIAKNKKNNKSNNITDKNNKVTSDYETVTTEEKTDNTIDSSQDNIFINNQAENNLSFDEMNHNNMNQNTSTLYSSYNNNQQSNTTSNINYNNYDNQSNNNTDIFQ